MGQYLSMPIFQSKLFTNDIYIYIYIYIYIRFGKKLEYTPVCK